MSTYILDFQSLDRSKLSVAGGKGANLGELSRIKGVQVPGGFCVSTEAYKKLSGESPELHLLLDELDQLLPHQRQAIGGICGRIRAIIEVSPVPPDIVEALNHSLRDFDENEAFAVRSSATAEDLPSASFAGQQDTYLNVIGKDAVLAHVRKCWASLFTDRAVIYRMQNGFDHRQVYVSVVVQKMVFPEVSGIVFTADPVTGHRKQLSIEASFGLGEALVSGIVSADVYKVQGGLITEKNIAAKKLAVYGIKGGGTETRSVDPERQATQALTDLQILRLAETARQIEAHFDSPQDIEWCLAGESFYVVQSRPITTLFPIPEPNDQENRVYVSVGHQQMMTDPIKPLGLSFYLAITPAPMRIAGGRLFVDITAMLRTSAGRKKLTDTWGHADLLTKDALLTIIGREGFLPMLPEEDLAEEVVEKEALTATFKARTDGDPAIDPSTIVSDLIKNSEESVNTLRQNISGKSGAALFEFIREDLTELKRILFDPRSFAVFMTAMEASAWINEKMMLWLGEKNVADTLSIAVPHNISSEMGLALMDLADVVRPYPEVLAFFHTLKHDNPGDFFEALLQYKGGDVVSKALNAYLDKYGMRCAGEIDITRTRWREDPTTLVPLMLNNVRNFESGASGLKFEKGRQEAQKKEEDLLSRLKNLPEGEQKAREAKRVIDLIRDFIGYREYPKYGKVSRYLVYKTALMKEAEKLVTSGLIKEKEDVFYLYLEEFHEAVRTDKVDEELIRQRKEAYRSYAKLSPPRVITSDGELITGRYQREDLPAGAIPGLAVSSGLVEGRARVILDMEDVDLDEGDILVTTFTDPSWTPLFVSIKGLITEVGGLMTHGAVVAREYGLPAVVGVQNATLLIKDGQRIRVNGTDGYVEIL